MVDVFYIGAYWWNRKEDLATVVNKTIMFLQELSNLDKEFMNWYEKGYNKKEASRRVSIEKNNIETLYKNGIKKNDLDNEGFSNIGYSIDLWTGHKEEYSSSISINGGHASKFFSNSCVIILPIAEESKERLLKLDKQKAVISLLIKIWQPDSVVLNSNKLKDETGLINKIGWVTYFKNLNQIPKFSENIIHETLNNGHLYYLKTKNDICYDYDLINELLSLKKLV
ncbi:MAG TPA: Imm52 family immunity protein [Chitinophagaceae bacterium]|nr:Imm52 family immunity protein [Chitinophagaceae bacterium]